MKLLLADTNSIEKSGFLLRHESRDINESVLESMMGQTFDAEQITLTETDSLQCSDKPIYVLESMNENRCLLKNTKLPNVVQVNKSSKKVKQFR